MNEEEKFTGFFSETNQKIHRETGIARDEINLQVNLRS